jgi:hypothetical protein
VICYRCEFRAVFLEKGHGPRSECKDIEHSNIGCYMYRPCMPVVMKRNEGDKRPAHGGPMMGARMSAVKIADDCVLINTKNDWLTWVPKGEE